MEKCNYIKEKDLSGRVSPITASKLKAILEQIEKCICDIKCPLEGHGTGFFCTIPYPNFFSLKPVLITNNHVLNEKDISEGKTIKITLNNETIHKEIEITNKRKIYTDEKLDITIIELEPEEDGIEIDSFLEIDKKINCKEPNIEFKNIDIYIIGNIQEYTYGKIKQIDEDGNIAHFCPTKPGMSGSPIINLNNFKVIGIHKGAHPKKEWNLGTFLKEPINIFYNLKSKNSEINDNKIKSEDIQIEKDENNINKKDEIYKTIDIENMKVQTSFEIKMTEIINKLKDGRMAIISCGNFYVFNLNNKNNCDIKIDLDIGCIPKMDILSDGNLLIQGREIKKIIKVNEKDIEIIETIKVKEYDNYFYILSNNNILKYNSFRHDSEHYVTYLYFYFYKNNSIINLNKNFELTEDYFFLEDLCEINENEIIISGCSHRSFLTDIFDSWYYKLYFYDFKHNIKKRLKLGGAKINENHHLYKITKNIVAMAFVGNILLVDTIQKEIFIKIALKEIKSIIPLDEKNFLVQDKDRIKHYELQKKKYNLKCSIKIEDNSRLLTKYDGNKLIIDKDHSKIVIYG